MSWPIDDNPRHWLCSVIGTLAITGIVAISGLRAARGAFSD